MRSNLIFGALDKVPNRYMLCQVASKATRKFHRPATRVQETMNDVLVRFSSAEKRDHVIGSGNAPVAEIQRKAA
jgi:hypothetical protein